MKREQQYKASQKSITKTPETLKKQKKKKNPTKQQHRRTLKTHT